jgi:glyceraldehyde 3-phosphate dehydrogenase
VCNIVTAGHRHSCIFSPRDTGVKDGGLVKVLAWYDNEWGFSSRCVDMLSRMV